METLRTKHTAGMKTLDMVYIAVFAGLIAVCAWISIPTAVPFTLQVFGVFTALGLLGGRRGTLSVFIYILLGMIGIPVFAGFQGGAGVIFGTTGGYLIGYLAAALLMWAIEVKMGRNTVVLAVSMLLGLIVCYAFGTMWFQVVYTQKSGAVGTMAVLGWCVFPFIIPDLLKLALALFVTKRFRRYVEK